MNKELYKKKEEIVKRTEEIYNEIGNIQSFLYKYENCFVKKESINALKRIRDYLIKKRNDLNNYEAEYKKLSKELCSTCKHEIAIKRNSYHDSTYNCLICNFPLENYKALISIDVSLDKEALESILYTVNKVVNSDKDLVSEISSVVCNIEYDRNIKVYRRQRRQI